MSLLYVSGVVKQLNDGFALRDVSFEQQMQQKLAVAGETGSGKSTLLRIIAGLVQPDRGEVLFKGQRVKGPDEQLLPGHKRIAYLSQQYELRNHYRVEEVLDMANALTNEDAALIYEVCRISHLLRRRTDQLSGGERQRIALARLPTTLPQLLVLDEPYSNLDPIHKSLLKTVIEDIGSQLKITCILASHDPTDTLSWADELLVLKGGAIVQQGPPQAVYARPADAYVAGLFGPYNHIARATVFDLFGIVVERPAGRELMIRPEQFQLLENAEKHAARGIVQRVVFCGAYSLVYVRLGHETIIAASLQPYIAGDPVYIKPDAGKIWHI